MDLEGGDGCATDEDDWVGTETFHIVRSAHPDIDPGCTYTMDVVGDFTGFSAPPVETETLPATE